MSPIDGASYTIPILVNAAKLSGSNLSIAWKCIIANVLYWLTFEDKAASKLLEHRQYEFGC
jgi:hypothetical protein